VCKVVLEDPLDLLWVDATTFETEFQVEVSVNGSPFIPYTTVRSHSTHSTGTRYLVATGSVPYDTDYRFRVRAVNRDTGQQSSFSPPSNVCRTPHLPPKQSGCFSGKVDLQGRSDHSGAAVYYHGFPVAVTNREGGFRFCGIPAGKHPIRSRATCYLEAELSHAWAAGGATVALPYTALRGGDINNDARVDLFDLVRVGADYRSEPPNDPEADCNADGRVDLFDLVMVSANYGLHGPTAWGDDLKRVRSLPDGAPPAVDFGRPGTALQGRPAGAPIALGEARPEAETLVVPITVRGIEGLYGVDITLAYDPRRVAPVDGQPNRPGLQLAVGREWESPQAFVVRNAVDQDAGRVYFAASRLKPAAPVRGDVVLAEFAFRALGDDTEGAVLLAGAALSDVRGRSLPARWEGLDLLRLVRLYLPRVVAGQPEG